MLYRYMKFTHVTLAIISGLALLVIMIGVYYANNVSSKSVSKNTTDTKVTETATQTNKENESNTSEVPEVETESIRAGAILDLSGQGLTEVPQYVFQRLGIEKLDVSNNLLEGSLQAEVRHLSNLIELDLSYNSFTGVPAEVGQLSKLQVLNLSHNTLTGLPLELGNLQNLKILDLRGNAYAKEDVVQIRAALPQTTEVLID